jgi:hypothetical protein
VAPGAFSSTTLSTCYQSMNESLSLKTVYQYFVWSRWTSYTVCNGMLRLTLRHVLTAWRGPCAHLKHGRCCPTLHIHPCCRLASPCPRCVANDMPGDDAVPNGHVEGPHRSSEEGQTLLTNPFDDSSPIAELPPLTIEVNAARPNIQRQSSLSQPRPPGTPRTTNRVRFDIQDRESSLRESQEWVDNEDYLESHRQDAPLLTNITPPADSPFLSDGFQPEDHLPNARPKSGTRSAVMNMANSIIGAGEPSRSLDTRGRS